MDIIISEWMGYSLLFEGMLSSVLVARDRWCGSTGLVFPDIAEMILCGWYDELYYQKKIGFWSNVYGFKMSAFKEQVWSEPQMETIQKTSIITNVCTFKTLDINRVKLEELDFTSSFALTITDEKPKMHGFVIYFDIKFLKNCQHSISFSTGPFTKDTHWHQTIFIIEDPIIVSKGDKVVGNISYKHKHRNLNIYLEYSVQGKTQPITLKYTL